MSTKYFWCSLCGIQCVGAEIEDLEYTPKPEFEGHFKVTNTRTEVGYGHHEKLLDVFSHLALLSVEDIKLFVDEYLKAYHVVRVRCL